MTASPGRPPGWVGCTTECRALSHEIAVLKSTGGAFADRRAAQLSAELYAHAGRLHRLLNPNGKGKAA